MKIEAVDFFYLSMPEVLDIGDGSQDALLVRIRAGGEEGWGECEASPLTSIASYICPMSHSACKPLKYSLEGESIKEVSDILRISDKVHEHSPDLLQADHTLSGIDIALYDLLGKKTQTPVFNLLGFEKVYPKLPYASQLFGDTPHETFKKGKLAVADGYKAVKFGWGPFGKNELKDDIDHLQAARESIGNDTHLMIDAGTVWGEDTIKAKHRLQHLKNINAFWLEEPFFNLDINAYQSLSQMQPAVHLAGGEGCNNFLQAQAMLDYAGLKFIQIDAGRIGGISVAKRVVNAAASRNISFVNHTFTSHLALSASLQAYAGIEKDFISEYPVELKQLAKDITSTKVERNSDGFINVPELPGLGVTVDTVALKQYLVPVEIRVKGKTIYYTPDL